jgi:hypothetical protein
LGLPLQPLGPLTLPSLAQHVADSDDPPRPFHELGDSGLLWLINTVVFGPRGFALALAANRRTGDLAAGWVLLGDGTQPLRYADDCTARFAAAEATLRAAAARADGTAS